MGPIQRHAIVYSRAGLKIPPARVGMIGQYWSGSIVAECDDGDSTPSRSVVLSRFPEHLDRLLTVRVFWSVAPVSPMLFSPLPPLQRTVLVLCTKAGCPSVRTLTRKHEEASHSMNA